MLFPRFTIITKRLFCSNSRANNNHASATNEPLITIAVYQIAVLVSQFHFVALIVKYFLAAAQKNIPLVFDKIRVRAVIIETAVITEIVRQVFFALFVVHYRKRVKIRSAAGSETVDIIHAVFSESGDALAGRSRTFFRKLCERIVIIQITGLLGNQVSKYSK